MLTVHGRLTNPRNQPYDGYRVAVSFSQAPPPADPSAGPPGAAAVDTPIQFFVDVGDDGGFALGIAEPGRLATPLTVTVLGPDGEAQVESAIAADALEPVAGTEDAPGLEIPVEPRAPARPGADPFAGPPVKVRGRVLHAEGHRQVAQRQVLVFAHREGDPALQDFVVLAARTDSQGFFFGEFRRLPDERLDRAYAVVAGAVDLSGEAAVPIPLSDGRLPRQLLLVVRLGEDPKFDDECACHAQLPRAPDHHDLVTSPAYSADLGGKCVKLTVPNRALEEFVYFTVVRTTDPALIGEGAAPEAPAREPISLDNPVPWEWNFGPVRIGGTGDRFIQAASISHGHLLQYKQTWRADGYSLGDLLYSLPLAPLQKKQIAVLDWERREQATRIEELDATESLQNQLGRDRDISEIIQGTINEHSAGGSESITLGMSHGSGAAGSGSFGFLDLGGVVASAFGGGYSSSKAWQDSARDLTLSSLNQLSDRTSQSSSAVRSQRATVVQSVTQGETARVQTEVVVNFNHCHAITIEYFEVLRHFQVTHDLVDVKECLFVPLLMTDYDHKKVLRWRRTLERALLDPARRGGFDAIDRLESDFYRENNPLGIAHDVIRDVQGEGTVTLTIARPQDTDGGDFLAPAWEDFRVLLGNKLDVGKFFADNMKGKSKEEKDAIFLQDVAPLIAAAAVNLVLLTVANSSSATPKGMVFKLVLLSRFQPGVPLRFGVQKQKQQPLPGIPPLNEDITRAEVEHIGIIGGFDKPLSALRLVVNSISLRYRTDRTEHLLFADPALSIEVRTENEFVFPTPLDAEEAFLPRAADLLAARRLMTHLNEHIEYYHRAIWWNMDPDRRYLLLDGILAPNAGGRSVASVVENRLLGIVGNALVLPLGPGIRLDPSFRIPRPESDIGLPADLLSVYQVDQPPPPLRVSVPTRGVFAEAVMGSCNSCEVKDETRFWRFEEAPSGDNPTPIAPLSTSSRRSDPGDLRPADFAESLVKLIDPSTLPDPQAQAAALSLLAQKDLFTDLTGLDATQKNALAILGATLSATKTFGSQAAELAGQQATENGGIDKMLQSVQKARNEGRIDDKQAKELITKALLARAGGTKQKEQKPKGKPGASGKEVKDAVESAAQSGKSKATVIEGDKKVSAETSSEDAEGEDASSGDEGSSDDTAVTNV